MSEYLNEELKKISNDEARDFISLLFDGYLMRKKNGSLYKNNDAIPKNIIKIYYDKVEKPEFDQVFANFRKKYIENECKIEGVHSKEEVEGLGIVYDYIHTYLPEKNINIYIILSLHSLLFSKCPYPEFGGKFRNQDIFLPGTGIATECYDNIPKVFSKMYNSTQELVKEGLQLGLKCDGEQILEYIEKCVILKCTLIKIHPFMDGNGRTIRAFMNILFKLANIPPTYVTLKERDEYGKAMQRAIGDDDFNDIITFYYYKVCDSINSLDIELQKKKIK